MNVKSLFQRPERYTQSSTNQSPAARAAAKWDQREGEIIEQNYTYRKLVVGLMLCCVGLGGALTYKCLSSSVVPYVLTYDASTGEVRGVGTAQQMANFQPNEQMQMYFIRQFIKDARNIPLDPVIYKSQLTDAYNFLTTDAANILQSKMAEEKTTEKFGKKTVQVNITNILPIDDGKSYQVRWTEDEYTIGSQSRTVTPYTAILTVSYIKSTDEEQLKKNPIGMYISDIRWDKDSTTDASGKKIQSTDTSKAVSEKAQSAVQNAASNLIP